MRYVHSGGLLRPADNFAQEYIDGLGNGEVVEMVDKTRRDNKFHSAYMGLLGYVWEWMPGLFKERVKKVDFYIFLKDLQGLYDVIYTKKDGTKVIKYKSIKFGRMSQKTFDKYVKEQLVVIYEDVIRPVHGDNADDVIADIEHEWNNFLTKL